MDNARLIIAIVLSILVFVVWDFFMGAKQPVTPIKQGTQLEQTEKNKNTVKSKDTLPLQETSVKPEKVEKKPVKPARIITVNTPLYTVAISENHGAFKRLDLKKYRKTMKPDSPLLDMISPDPVGGTVILGYKDHGIKGLEKAIFTAEQTGNLINVESNKQTLNFSWISPEGIQVEKQYTFNPESYLIGLNVIVKNGSSQQIKDSLTLSLFKSAPENSSRYGFEGPSAYINNKLEEIKIKKIKKKSEYNGNIQWIALEDRYFMSAIIPEQGISASMHLSLNKDKILQNQYIMPEDTVFSNDQKIYKFKLFFGPKSMKVLKTVDYNLVEAVHFGWFDIIAKPCVWIMNFLYDHFIPNYGIAIIILTILSKILLWPLGTKSYKSMAQMKTIQPLMAEIKAKYKDDKKKMNEETMALYKTYKVNPLGGCLPMVVQIPVFFALYRMLYQAIELRHAPFVWWITDLSAPDRLFSFNFSVPFMQPPYGIPVLTIIMGATMFFQQKMSPPVGDSSQAKMMMMMPLVFTVVFINFSSGLVLYWLINNVISMAQQYYTQKKYT